MPTHLSILGWFRHQRHAIEHWSTHQGAQSLTSFTCFAVYPSQAPCSSCAPMTNAITYLDFASRIGQLHGEDLRYQGQPGQPQGHCCANPRPGTGTDAAAFCSPFCTYSRSYALCSSPFVSTNEHAYSTITCTIWLTIFSVLTLAVSFVQITSMEKEGQVPTTKIEWGTPQSAAAPAPYGGGYPQQGGYQQQGYQQQQPAYGGGGGGGAPPSRDGAERRSVVIPVASGPAPSYMHAVGWEH
jgi:hypothetical protein